MRRSRVALLFGCFVALGLLWTGLARADCEPCLLGKRACRRAAAGEFRACKEVCQFGYRGDRGGRAGCTSACKRKREEVQARCLEEGRACRANCGPAESACLERCAEPMPKCLRPVEDQKKHETHKCRVEARKARRECRGGPPPRKPCNAKVNEAYGDCLTQVAGAAAVDARDCVAAVGVCVERCAEAASGPAPPPSVE